MLSNIRVAQIGIENNQICYVYECDRKNMTKLKVTQCYYATPDQLSVNPQIYAMLSKSVNLADWIFYTPITDKPTVDLLSSSHGIFDKVLCDTLIIRTKDDNLAKVLFMKSYRDAAAEYVSNMQKIMTLPIEEVIR